MRLALLELRCQKADEQALQGGFEAPVADARAFVEHDLGRLDLIGVAVFVGEVNDLFDAGLDDHLGALVARKETHIDAAVAQVGGDRVEHRVQFRVADIRVFGVEELSLAFPGQLVIGTAPGKAVVADTDDLVLVVGDAGPHLSVGVLAALGGKQGHRHEVLVPGEVVLSFHRVSSPFWAWNFRRRSRQVLRPQTVSTKLRTAL